MRLRALALAIGASLALHGAAQAADLRDFQAMCVATQADSKAALAAADAAGWMPIPDALLTQLKRPGMETAQGRLKSDNGGMRFMLTASSATLPNVPGFKMDACVVGFAPSDPTIADQVKTWAAVPEFAAMSKNGAHAYAFVDNNGRHEAIAGQEAEPMTVFKTRHTELLLVQDQPQATLVVFGVPSTTSPN